MKIHADKVDGAPPHSLSVRDVRTILARVPPGWSEGVTEARLANSLEHSSPWAFFSSYHGSLTIYCRGATKRLALVAVLSALAASSLNIKMAVGRRRRPSEADRHRLEQFIQPLVEQILPDMTPPEKQSPEAHEPWPSYPDKAGSGH
jgi:hypothetical protein